MGSLTDRQRRYAALVAAGRTPLEAMDAAGYGLKCRPRWLKRNLADARIAALVTRLRAGWADDAPAAVSKHGITRMLAADRRLAYREGSPGAAVAASVAIARINGWIGDARHPEAKPLEEMSDAALQRYLLALEPREDAAAMTPGERDEGEATSCPGEGEPAEGGAGAPSPTLPRAGGGSGTADGLPDRDAVRVDDERRAEAAQGPEAAPRPAAADAAGCEPGSCVDDAEPAAAGSEAGAGGDSCARLGKRALRRLRGRSRRGGGAGGGRG